MSNIVAEAVEIYAKDGYGIPTSYINTDIGLPSGGVFALITGRNGLNGSKKITGDTARTVWYEDIIAKNAVDFAPSHIGDFVEGGCLEAVAGMTFSLINTTLGSVAAFWRTLKAENIYLGRCVIVYYRVTSSDGITFHFERRETMVIDDQPFTELTYSLLCVSNAKSIFKSHPSIAVGAAAYPLAPKDSLEKFIPQAFGRVAYSPLLNVQGAGTKVDLCLISGVLYNVAAGLDRYAGSATYPANIQLKTDGVFFSDNDSRLVKKYLHIIAGGVDQYIRITSNTATSVASGTLMALVEPLNESTPWKAWANTRQPDTDVWYAQVVDLLPALVVSDKPIYAFGLSAQGSPAIFEYDSGSNKYIDISEIGESTSISNINATALPGYSIIANEAGSETSLSGYLPINPAEIKQVALAVGGEAFTTSDVPAIGSSAPKLFDRQEGTGHYYTLTKSITTSAISQIRFDVMLPPDDSLKVYGALYLLLDIIQSNNAANPATCQVNVSVSTLDIYGREVPTAVYPAVVFSALTSTTPTALNLLPRKYFNLPENDFDFYKNKAALDISAIIGDTKKGRAYTTVRVQLDFGFAITLGGSGTYTALLEEIGLVGKIAVPTSTGNLYGPIIGGTFGDSWDGRKGADNPIEFLPDALEGLLRQGDLSAPAWLATEAYAVGDRIKGVDDIARYFRCTTAGTSGATEPVWIDTVAATYTDGTAVWTEDGEIPIDTAAFDALEVPRAWPIGRTLTDPTQTEDIVTKLCKQGFLIGQFDPFGKFSVAAWRESRTPLTDFNISNIYPNTLKSMPVTPVRRVSNQILMKYDRNPAANKFNAQIGVANIDKPAFPLSTDYTPGSGTSLGAFTGSRMSLGGGAYRLTFTTTLPHGRATGDIATLTGNTNGYNFTPRPISVSSPTVFALNILGAPPALTTSSGSLKSLSDSNLRWHDYAPGFQSYAAGLDAWTKAHTSFLQTKAINEAPSEITECDWFFDPYAVDPGGNLFWPDQNVGDEHPAAWSLGNHLEWTAFPKKNPTFEIIDNAFFSSLRIGNCVSLTHAQFTGGSTLIGYISEKTQIPRTKTDPERFRIALLMEPEAADTNLIIDENGATDIYDENSATNIIDEN